jgi:cytochrome c556
MNGKFKTIAATALLASLSFGAYAQSAAERSIQYRQGVMRAQGWHLGNMAAQVKGDKPYNKDDFARSATFVSQLLQMPWDGYGPGTETGAPTKAKAEIWLDSAKFKADGEEASKAAVGLAQAAASGNMDQIKVAFGATAKACKTCHDNFRSK